jgi:hypothetical protein
MKKLVVLFMALISFSAMSQSDSTKKCSVTPYVSLGISIGNNTSYPSIELGVCYKNLTLGVTGGTNSFSKGDLYPWFELKTTASKQFGGVNVFGILGTGFTISSFDRKPKTLIEYGAGFSYSVNKFTYSVQGSNFYGTWYLSPAITYNF